ncbi:MAG: transporter ATP-binding protein [Bacillales bacterium]|jgi:ABC-2 type transport system ATP-binding protein|nr:transporter ATP-binding protein [Bacillales bacterium]
MNLSYVSIRNITKSFGAQKVLDGINLDVRQGEIYGLLGPSGAGKTTLVKMLTNLEKQDSGDITFEGINLPSSKVIHKIGYMSQSDALYQELTAGENLDFFAALFGIPAAKRVIRIHEVAKVVNLQDHLKKSIQNYSGGMRRRLSLAASLLHEPDLLILDEPTVGIDPVLRQQIWTQFNILKNQGKTIIVTTHVMDEAEKCDRVGLLRDGKIIAEGSPEEIIKEAGVSRLEDAFLVLGGK